MVDELKYCRSSIRLADCGEAFQLLGERTLAHAHGSCHGAFVTQTYDSGVDGTIWNRLTVDAAFHGRLRVYVLAGDDPGAWSLIDSGAPWEDKVAFFRQNAAVAAAQAADVLLYDARGRFLRVCVETYEPDRGFSLRGYEISFPKQTFTGYLPQIYRGNTTLERFMGILQSYYMDTERQIDRFAERLRPSGADAGALRTLLRWMGMEAVSPLPGRPAGEDCTPEQLTLARALVENAVWLNRRKGTRAAMARLLHLIAGEPPAIVEPSDWEPLAATVDRRRQYARLYGEGRSFCVLLRRTSAQVERAVREFSPVGTEGRIVSLRDGAPLGGHCYLGVNTRLCDAERAVLDDQHPVSVQMRLH